MALKLTKRARSPFYYITGTLAGQRVRESTKTSNRRAAETVLRGYEKRLLEGTYLPAKEVSHSSEPTVKEYVPVVEAARKRVLHKSTLDGYRTAWRAAVALFGELPLSRLTRKHAARYAEEVRFGSNGAPRSRATVSSYLAGMQALLSFAMKDEDERTGQPWITRNVFTNKDALLTAVLGPAGESEHDSGEDTDPAPYPLSEQTEILAKARAGAFPDYVAILIGLRCGLRRSEVLGLDWSAIDFRRSVIKVRQKVSRNRVSPRLKTKKSKREVPLPNGLAADLKQLRKLQLEAAFKRGDGSGTVSGPVFPASKQDPRLMTGRMDDKKFGDRFARYIRAAELEPGLHPFHRPRHTYASELLASNVAVSTVSRWMGHSNTSETERTYAHWVPRAADHDVVNALEARSAHSDTLLTHSG